MGGTVGADRIEAILDQLTDVRLDAVADRSHLLDWPPGRVRYIPRFDTSRHIWAGVVATHRDRPISVELHLEGQLLGLAPSQVDADLAHRLHHRGPNLRRRLGAGGLGAHILRAVALEERLGHL